MRPLLASLSELQEKNNDNFPAVLSKKRRHRHARYGLSAVVFAASRGCHDFAEQEKDGGALPTRGHGWTKRRHSLRRTELLPDTPDDRDPAAAAWRRGGRD
jgi:hypothetical protein